MEERGGRDGGEEYLADLKKKVAGLRSPSLLEDKIDDWRGGGGVPAYLYLPGRREKMPEIGIERGE